MPFAVKRTNIRHGLEYTYKYKGKGAGLQDVIALYNKDFYLIGYANSFETRAQANAYAKFYNKKIKKRQVLEVVEV